MNEAERLLVELIEAKKSADGDRINKAKYDILFFGRNLLDVINNYLFLNNIGIPFDFGRYIIKKGTHLFRIRCFEEETNYAEPRQWSYPPTMPENRANRAGTPALYLGSTELVCLLETHIKKDEKYVLGEYEAIDDIILGGFLESEDYKKITWYLAGAILNAFLIAPSRCEKNKELFAFLDQKYSGIQPDDLQMDAATHDIDLPLKFGVLNLNNRFYEMTNRLVDCLKVRYPEGVFYSSSYLPMATIGILCSDFNIALYEPAFAKIKLVKHTVKTKESDVSGLELIRVLTGGRGE